MIDRTKLYDALRQMRQRHLKDQYKNDLTPERPTTGYCYIVAEVVYHYLAPRGYSPHVMKTGDNETLWFLKNASGDIKDLTSGQFGVPPDYSKGKPQNILTKDISKRGRILAVLLKLTDEVR